MTTNLVKLLEQAKECNDRNAKNGMSFYYADKLIEVIRLQAEGLENCNCHHVAKETNLKLEQLLEDAT